MAESTNIEAVKDDHELYRFIHEVFRSENKGEDYISPSSLKFHSNGLSTDWDQKTIPPENPKYTRRQPKNNPPEKYGVIGFLAKKIRGLNLEITPEPTQTNPAHTLVINNEEILYDLDEIVYNLAELATWKIHFSDPVEDIP